MTLVISTKKGNFTYERHTHVYFLGVKIKNFLYLKKKKVPVKDLSVHRKKILLEYKNTLINLDKNIPDVSDSLWLASDLAENNLCLENFSLYILNSLAIIKEVLPKYKDVVFICDDDEQVFIYSKILKNNGFEVSSRINYFFLLKRMLGFLWRKMREVSKAFWKILILKFLRIYHKTPIDLSIVKKSKVLCVNWIGLESFNPENLFFKDRYFGDFLSHLKKSNIDLAVIGKPLDFNFPFYKIIKNSLKENKSSLFIQDFVKIREVLYSFVVSFRFLRYFNHRFKIDDINFSSLWKWFCLKDALNYRMSLALETYYASQNIFREIEESSITLVYPYENQPWEKLLSLSFRTQFPKGKVFAYQHFPVAQDYLTCYPSQAYISKKISPTILLSDEIFGKRLKDIGFLDYKLLGNVRLSSLEDATDHLKKFSRSTKRKILCSCSIQLNDSLELVNKVSEIMENLTDSLLKNITLVVNFHPYMSQDAKKIIEKTLKDKKINSVISDLNWDALIDECYLVFYNSSSVSFSAAARGIPALFIKSDIQIDVDKMADASFQISRIEEGSKVVEKLLEDKTYYTECCKKFKSFFEAYYKKPDYKMFQFLLTK